MCSLSNMFACISPITSTKNIGAILMQNEDLNALQITGTMNHIITLSVTQCLSKWHYNYYRQLARNVVLFTLLFYILYIIIICIIIIYILYVKLIILFH